MPDQQPDDESERDQAEPEPCADAGFAVLVGAGEFCFHV